MNQPMAHACYIAPFDLRIALTNRFWNIARRLADHFNGSNDSTLFFGVCGERLVLYPHNELLRVTGFNEHILEKFKVIARCTQTYTTSFTTFSRMRGLSVFFSIKSTLIPSRSLISFSKWTSFNRLGLLP